MRLITSDCVILIHWDNVFLGDILFTNEGLTKEVEWFS